MEARIHSIENLMKLPTDEAYIQAAQASRLHKQSAEVQHYKLSLFDYIQDWETFKASLCTKFGGTYTLLFFIRCCMRTG